MLPQSWESTPAVGCTGGGRYLHVAFALITPQGPHMQGIWPQCRAHIRLGLLCGALASQRCRDGVIRQVTARPGCAPRRGCGGSRGFGAAGKLWGSEANIVPHPCRWVPGCQITASFSSGWWKDTGFSKVTRSLL